MIHQARWDDLSPTVLHDLIRLRIDVFVVEQQAAYPELDGRDPQDSTVHVWAEDDGTVTGYLRVLAEPEGHHRIGRVCVAAHARGAGIAGALMRTGLELAGPTRVDVSAQAHLAGWYTGFGFEACGPEFTDDGIAHVPMRRASA